MIRSVRDLRLRNVVEAANRVDNRKQRVLLAPREVLCSREIPQPRSPLRAMNKKIELNSEQVSQLLDPNVICCERRVANET